MPLFHGGFLWPVLRGSCLALATVHVSQTSRDSFLGYFVITDDGRDALNRSRDVDCLGVAL